MENDMEVKVDCVFASQYHNVRSKTVVIRIVKLRMKGSHTRNH